MSPQHTPHLHGDATKYVTYHNTDLPVIVMIHGFRGTHHGLDLIAKSLPNYHIIVPDVPGFGQSKPLESEHSLKNYTDWLRHFITSLELSAPPVLVGHSFGSIITSSFAARYPHLISKLILINPIGAPALKGPKAIMTRFALLYYWLGRALPERLAMKWLSAKSIVMIMSVTMAKTHDKSTRKFIHDQHLTHFSSFANRRIVAEAFKTSVNHTVRDVAREITIRTLLIAGDKDDITPIEKQRQLLALFPDAKLETIHGVGHLTHYETPDQVGAAIQVFMRE